VSTRLLFLSYHGPDDKSSGIRVGRLALAATRAGLLATIIHSAERDDRYVWRDSVNVRTFRRTDPSAWRDRRRPPTESYKSLNGSWSSSFVQQMVRRLARVILQPDEMILSRHAFATACAAESRGRAAVHENLALVASGPPWSTILVGLAVARRERLPLVLDFQDLWSLNPVAKTPFLGHALARLWERRSIATAEGAIFVNGAVSKRYQSAFPRLEQLPHAVAPIGFERDPAVLLSVRPGKQLIVGHFGSIYGDRSFASLLSACDGLASVSPRPVIHWYGEFLGDHPMQEIVPHYVQRGTLTIYGPIKHSNAKVKMGECDLLLTVPSPTYCEELTTKLYDYIDARRPILGLAPGNSLLAHFLSSSGIGEAYAPDDVDGLREFVGKCAQGAVEFRPNVQFLASHQLPALGVAVRDLIERIVS
jgi:hypothetical protein